MKLKELVENHRKEQQKQHEDFLAEQEKALQDFNKKRTEKHTAKFKEHFADQIPILEDAGISFEVVESEQLQDEISDKFELKFKNKNKDCTVRFLKEGDFYIGGSTYRDKKNNLLIHLYETLIEPFQAQPIK